MAARIPSYQRRVAPEATGAPQVREASTDASGLARGLSSLAGSLSDIHQREVQEANQTYALSTDTGASQKANEMTFDPNNGVLSLRGANALGVTEQRLKDWDAYSASVIESAPSAQQKQIATRVLTNQRQQLQSRWSGHEFQQQQVYKDGVDQASILTAQNTAALNYNDPAAIDASHTKIVGVMDIQAQRNGWSPELKEANLQKATSGMYSDILRRQAAEDPYKAQAALKNYQQYLTGDDVTQIGGSIEVKIDRLQQKAEMARLRAEARADRTLAKVGAQIASGIPATDEMLSAWASQVRGTPAQAEFNELIKQQTETQKVLRLPIDQQIAFVNQKTAELQQNGGTVADGTNLNRLNSAIEKNVKMMSESPLDYFQQRLGGDVAPLDLNAPDLDAQLSGRAEAIQGMRQKFGSTVAMKPLLPQEAKQLTAQLDTMAPDQKTQLFAKLHSALGDDQMYMGAMQQIAPDSPITALTGVLAGKQRSMTLNTNWFKPDDVVSSGDVAKVMAVGESILNKSKSQKSEDGTSRFPIPKQQDFQQELDRQLNGVFAGQPQSYGLAAQAVKSYYTGLAAQKGDISGEVDRGLLRQSIKATVGEVVDFNGSRTLAPWGMPADTFETAARQRLTSTLQAQGASETELATASALTLRQSKDGVYYVMQGQQFKYGADGKPLTINLNEAGQ